MINDNDILNLHRDHRHRMILVEHMSKVLNVKVVVHDEIVNVLERVPWVSLVSFALVVFSKQMKYQLLFLWHLFIYLIILFRSTRFSRYSRWSWSQRSIRTSRYLRSCWWKRRSWSIW
jgi:hypothetical protein